jgi:hypothetical protein
MQGSKPDRARFSGRTNAGRRIDRPVFPLLGPRAHGDPRAARFPLSSPNRARGRQVGPMALKCPRSKWRQPFTCSIDWRNRNEDKKQRQQARSEQAPPMLGASLRPEAAHEEKMSGSRRKSLKRLDPRKTNARISFRFSLDFLPLGLGFPSEKFGFPSGDLEPRFGGEERA